MGTPTSIKDYYAGTTVLITGGTGFLGKAIIEKILRSCTDVKRVYTLLRCKRGVNSADRLEKLKNSEIFDRIRAENPDIMKKFYGLTGDISEDNLGLDAQEMDVIRKEVNIIIHSAATVRFNDPIEIALNTNVLGTRRVLDLCRTIESLKSIVHISTAYSNPSKRLIEEKVYASSPLKLDLYVTCSSILPKEVMDTVMESLHGYFPNTYTLTKHMAEQLVQDYRTQYQLPVSIVRPSIISASMSEPFPGWADTVNGVNGAVIELGRGTLGSIQVSGNAVMDVIPLDFVFNLILVAAWFVGQHPRKDIWVFNCTSGDRNGITWKTGSDLIVKHSREYPSKYTMFYPTSPLRTNRLAHRFFELVHTFLPAVLADLVLRIMGDKPMMYKIQQKFKTALHSERYFTSNEWRFEHGNVIRMQAAAEKAIDFREFNFDICTLDWDTYVRSFVLGMQKYILKIDMSALPRARAMLKLLYVARILYYGCIYASIAYIGYQLYAIVM